LRIQAFSGAGSRNGITQYAASAQQAASFSNLTPSTKARNSERQLCNCSPCPIWSGITPSR
jgi:hypothetical protein